MATQIGVIKQVSGLVVAVDENGTQRVLKAGDALFLGEVIKTSSAASKAVVSMDNGKDVTILGNESVKLDNSVLANSDNTVADVSDLQKALLDGKDLTKLEETAAGGGNAAAGGGDGVSLGAASFDEGGHYSNISENFRSLGDLNSATGAERIGGVSGAADNAGGDAAIINPDLTRIPNKPSKIEFPEDKDHNNKISDDENKAGDKDHGKTTVDVTVPTDGSVKPGDKVVIRDENGNEVKDKKITQEDLDNGGKVSIPDVPVKPGNNPISAEIVNPNNPSNPSGKTDGNIEEDHEVSIDLTPNPDGTVGVVSHDGDASKVEISYTDNNGNSQTITVIKNPSAGWVVDSTPGKTTAPATDFTLDSHSGKVVVSDNATKDGTSITAKVTDDAGNLSKVSATTPDKISIKFNDDTTPDGIITRAENYADEGTKATATISIPNLAKDGSKIKISGTGINDGEFTVHKDASGNVISVTDSNNKNVFDGNNGFTIAYKYTANGSNVNITAQLDNTALKTTGSVKFENVKMADVDFVELDSHGNVLSDKKTTNYAPDTTKGYTRVEAALDGDINHTTARISLPDNVQDGDIVTVRYGFGPDAASLAATGGTDTTAYKYFLVHKAADGSMTVDQITSATDKTPIKAGLTSTNGAGEKFGIDIHDMPTVNDLLTTSRGIQVDITGEDGSSVSMNPRYTNREKMQAPTVMFVEGSEELDPAIVGNGGPGSIGMKMEYAGLDGDIYHTTARIKLPSIFSDGDKLTVAITDYNKIYADTGVKVGPLENPAPTAVKTFVIHKAADGTVTFDEVDASGNVIHAGIPSVNNSAIDVSEITLYSRDEAGFVHATRVDATITDHLNLNGNDSASDIANYVFRETVNVKDVTITTIYDDFGSTTGDVSKGGKTDDKTPKLIGKADKFATIEIYDGTHYLGKTTADKDGNWNFTPETPLNDGEHKFTAKATIGGSSKTSDGYAITIDNTIGTIEARFVEDRNDDHRLTLKENKTDGNVKSTILQLKVSGSFENGDKITLHLDDPSKGSGNIVLEKVGNSAVVKSASESLKGMAPIDAAATIQTSSDGSKTIDISGIGMKKGSWTVAKAYITDEAGNKSNEVKDYFMYEGAQHAPTINASTIYGYNSFVGVLPGQFGSTKLQASELQHDKIDTNPDRDFDIRANVITRNSTVTLGDGDDHVTITKTGSGGYGWLNDRSTLNLGNGDNTLDVVNIDKATVTAGNGDDVVTVGEWQKPNQGWITTGSNIELGNGNNTLTVGTNIEGSTVKTGSGNDTIKVGNYIHNSTIELGAGDDTLEITRQDITGSNIDGGAGYDKLAITNPGTNVDLSNIAGANKAHNFEELDISNKGQNTTLKISLSDVMNLTDNDNILKITADAGDKVAFKDNSGWQKGASANGYTTYTNDTTGTTVTVEIKDEVTQPM